MQNIGGLRALQLMVIKERCCVTNKKLKEGFKPAIVRIERDDKVIFTINGNIDKSVRKGTRYYAGGKVVSAIRGNVVMTIQRTSSGVIYADCTQRDKAAPPRRGENLDYLNSLPAHIRKNVQDSRSKLEGVWG